MLFQSRIQLVTLLICSAALFSCSPKTDEPEQKSSIPPKVSNLQPRPPEAQPEPIPQLVVLFEFEGIPQSTLNAWVGTRRLKIIQQQLELDERGNPITEADIYILSPRLITHFIEKNHVAPWSPEPDLSKINPIFTSHPFDFSNVFAIPWRWTPMVLLKHKPDPDAPAPAPTEETPAFPEDPIMKASLQTQPRNHSVAIPTVPDPDAYRAAWEYFKATPHASIWIPAACPLRNTINYAKPEWTWSLPQSQTTIIFDHLLIGARSELKAEASELLSYLLASDQQDQLITTTGYFPVICPLGKETSVSPVPLPNGDWLNKSGFISLPAYTPPAAPSLPAAKATTDPSVVEPAPEANVSPAPTTSPTPETVPPAQTVY